MACIWLNALAVSSCSKLSIIVDMFFALHKDYQIILQIIPILADLFYE